MSRTEHMDWAKRRALQFVAMNDLAGAVASMVSDLAKHERTASLLSTSRIKIGVNAAAGNDSAGVRSWIEAEFR